MALSAHPISSILPSNRVFPGNTFRPKPRGVQKARLKAQLIQDEPDEAERFSPLIEESELIKRLVARLEEPQSL